MKPYVPSGRSDPGGVALVAIASLGAGVVAGTALHFVGKLINLLVVFPLLLGVAAAGAGWAVIARKRVRAPLVAGLLGLAGGTVAYAVDPIVERMELGAEVNIDMTFVEFLELRAAVGTRIGRPGSSSRGIELGATGTWVLWGLELAIAAGVGFWMAWSAAREPFCERCGRWYGAPSQAVVLGGLEEELGLRAALDAEDAGGLARLATLGPVGPGRGAVAVRVRRCPGCAEADLFVQVLRLKRDRRGKTEEKVVASGLVPAAFWTGAVAAMRAPPQGAA